MIVGKVIKRINRATIFSTIVRGFELKLLVKNYLAERFIMVEVLVTIRELGVLLVTRRCLIVMIIMLSLDLTRSGSKGLIMSLLLGGLGLCSWCFIRTFTIAWPPHRWNGLHRSLGQVSSSNSSRIGVAIGDRSIRI